MAPIAKASSWLGCRVVGSEAGRRAMKGPPEQGFGKDGDWVLSRLAWQQAGRSWVATRRDPKPPSLATPRRSSATPVVAKPLAAIPRRLSSAAEDNNSFMRATRGCFHSTAPRVVDAGKRG